MGTLKTQPVSLAVLDITMPYVTGIQLLELIKNEHPDTPVIILSAVNELTTAVECMKKGAFDYLTKPIDEDRLITSVKHAIDLQHANKEIERLKQQVLSGGINHPEAFEKFTTHSQKMHSIFKYAEAIAPSPLPVMITGETGVGKELIAQALHTLSGRQGGFVPVNIAGVDDHLFADTLFGHRKGAFTGADDVRKGFIESAQDGTLFLDEIGDLSMDSQVKLLRLLQEGVYYRLGSDVSKVTNAKIVVATHKDIDKMKSNGSFRADLYYRLQFHHIHLPPLRERREDYVLLLEYFLEEASGALNKKVPAYPKELLALFNLYSFPGNIREFQAMVFDAVSRHTGGTLSMNSFKDRISPDQSLAGSNGNNDSESIKEGKGRVIFPEDIPTLKEAENALIQEAMERANNNQTLAARVLGISRQALNNRLSRAKDA